MKKQIGKMLIQDMGLKVGEKFKVGRYVMVFAGNDGGKFDEIVPVKIWKRRQRDLLAAEIDRLLRKSSI